jgi:hypothetical protein
MLRGRVARCVAPHRTEPNQTRADVEVSSRVHGDRGIVGSLGGTFSKEFLLGVFPFGDVGSWWKPEIVISVWTAGDKIDIPPEAIGYRCIY